MHGVNGRLPGVQKVANLMVSHVLLTVTRIALAHHCCWLKHGHGDLGHRELFVVHLLCRNDWCVIGKHEVDTWVWHEVGPELSDVNLQMLILVGGALNIQLAPADIVESLMVHHDSHIQCAPTKSARNTQCCPVSR